MCPSYPPIVTERWKHLVNGCLEASEAGPPQSVLDAARESLLGGETVTAAEEMSEATVDVLTRGQNVDSRPILGGAFG